MLPLLPLLLPPAAAVAAEPLTPVMPLRTTTEEPGALPALLLLLLLLLLAAAVAAVAASARALRRARGEGVGGPPWFHSAAVKRCASAKDGWEASGAAHTSTSCSSSSSRAISVTSTVLFPAGIIHDGVPGGVTHNYHSGDSLQLFLATHLPVHPAVPSPHNSPHCLPSTKHHASQKSDTNAGVISVVHT